MTGLPGRSGAVWSAVRCSWGEQSRHSLAWCGAVRWVGVGWCGPSLRSHLPRLLLLAMALTGGAAVAVCRCCMRSGMLRLLCCLTELDAVFLPVLCRAAAVDFAHIRRHGPNAEAS